MGKKIRIKHLRITESACYHSKGEAKKDGQLSCSLQNLHKGKSQGYLVKRCHASGETRKLPRRTQTSTEVLAFKFKSRWTKLYCSKGLNEVFNKSLDILSIWCFVRSENRSKQAKTNKFLTARTIHEQLRVEEFGRKRKGETRSNRS